MTTHVPYEPPAQPGAYPTSPPWASPSPAPPQQQPPAPWGAAPDQHGRLMVPYPEEMVLADRPPPPSWVPVVFLADVPAPDQKVTGTPSRTSCQFFTKKSAGSIWPLACAQSISSWRISCCAL